VLTTLHSGGKFSGKNYGTSGGLHGVGLAVVNALSTNLTVKVTRGRKQITQGYQEGKLISSRITGHTSNATGTEITFTPDPKIFKDQRFDPEIVKHLLETKAYLNAKCKIVFQENAEEQKQFYYEHGIVDYLATKVDASQMLHPEVIDFEMLLNEEEEGIRCAFAFSLTDAPFVNSFCNSIYNPQGGVHEQAFRNAIVRSIKDIAANKNLKNLQNITFDDCAEYLTAIVSLHIRNPMFQGQTKEKLINTEIQRQMENLIKNQFETWLLRNYSLLEGTLINELERCVVRRLERKKDREVERKSPIKSLRLPGKLTDCELDAKDGTEIFLVEGDSAGGSAKQARNRKTQAILPLKGKIINTISNSIDKISANQELKDLITALGAGNGKNFDIKKLRYDKIIIMTDADVDGSHITTLLLSFFVSAMPELITQGKLYLARPPLFKITYKNESTYVMNEKEKEKFLAKLKDPTKASISRFKGLGEMSAAQLKETTMDPKKRILTRVFCDGEMEEKFLHISQLLGKNPSFRYQFICENSHLIDTSDII